MEWLAGFVDGDGGFHMYQNKNGSWDFAFKVSQSSYNMRLLAYLKKKLKCGSITRSGPNLYQYRLRDPDLLWFYLIPLFETTTFITDSKAFDYMKFKKALQVYIDCKYHNKYSKAHRNTLLNIIKNQTLENTKYS
jgi:hypothetical protein